MKFLVFIKNYSVRFFLLISICIALCIYFSNKTIQNNAENNTYDKIDAIPSVKVGILLGTSKQLKSGNINLYYQYRINATAELYNAGKIKKILISGDNSTKEYDEPNDMRLDLINLGIDSNDIILDYAGFRTFDSMIRLKEIFGQDTATVISQKFHNERAIYIAHKLGITVYGYNANDVTTYYGFKTQLREYLARVKTILDFTIGVEPKFLGEKLEIK
jgi:SanA protein